LFEHRIELARYTGCANHQALAELHRKSHCAANGVSDNFATRRQYRLLAIGGVNSDADATAPLLEVLHRNRIFGERNAACVRKCLCGEIVHCRSKSAIDEQHIAIARE